MQIHDKALTRAATVGRGDHHFRLSTTMELWHLLLSCFWSLWLAASANAAALTTAISPNERLCFYADVDKVGQKIGVRALSG